MGWERRHGAGPYYIRKHKIKGQVVREYFGRGLRAELAAEEDSRQRTMAAAAQAVRHHFDALDSEVSAWCQLIDTLTRASMLAAEYHQHHRHEWRKQYGQS